MRETFDLEALYDERISPLMAQILDICKQHRMPMVASFLYRRDEDEGGDLCTSFVQFPGRESAEFVMAFKLIRTGSVAFVVTREQGVATDA